MNGFRIFCTVRTSIAANEAQSVFKRKPAPDLIREPAPDLIREPAPDLIRGGGPVRVKKTRQIKNLEPRSILSKRKRLAAS
jgi:hypothetical protein